MKKTKDELERYHQAMAALAASFRRAVDAATLEGYAWGLEDLPIETIEAACRRAVRECPRMPSPAEIRELAGVMSAKSRAVSAWGDVMAAIVAQGAYRSVDFGDPRTHIAVRALGGWVALCGLSDHELGYAYRRFCDAYSAATGPVEGNYLARHLPGLAEMANAADGYPVDPPALVGRAASSRPQLPATSTGHAAGSRVGGHVAALRPVRSMRPRHDERR